MNFIHVLYNNLWRISTPIIKLYLRHRAKKNQLYLQNWNERFGDKFENAQQNVIWIHAVSVGETKAAYPIIQELQKRQPEIPILITQMTPTGRKTAQDIFPNIQCRYLPYDNPKYVKRFLDDHKPIIAIFMETEIWVNYIAECKKQNIPTILANARLSKKSLNGYLKFSNLFKPTFSSLSQILAQSINDKHNFQQLSKNNISVLGNTKYDINIEQKSFDLAKKFKLKIGNRPIFVCASTREKDNIQEEKLLLEAWQKEKMHQTNALLIIIPRHPERFETIFNLAKEMGFTTQKRSDDKNINPNTQVLIGDSMGELFAYYLCADMAFVGGSLVDTGCQNLIEPIACEIPTSFGFSTYNFQQASSDALTSQVATQVQNADEWAKLCRQYLENPDLGKNAKKLCQSFIQKHQGASIKTAQYIENIIT